MVDPADHHILHHMLYSTMLCHTDFLAYASGLELEDLGFEAGSGDMSGNTFFEYI